MDEQKNRPAQKSFRLSDETRQKLAALAKHLDVNETVIVTLAIGKMAQAEGVVVKKEGEP